MRALGERQLQYRVRLAYRVWEAPGIRLGIAVLIVKALPYYVLGTTDVPGLADWPHECESALERATLANKLALS